LTVSEKTKCDTDKEEKNDTKKLFHIFCEKTMKEISFHEKKKVKSRFTNISNYIICAKIKAI